MRYLIFSIHFRYSNLYFDTFSIQQDLLRYVFDTTNLLQYIIDTATFDLILYYFSQIHEADQG